MRLNKLNKRALLGLAMASCLVFTGMAFGQSNLAPTPSPVTIRGNKTDIRKDVELGQREEQQLLSQGLKPLNDQAVDAYLQKIGDRAVAVLPKELQHPEIHYRFKAAIDPSWNAFALSDGTIYVNTGLIAAVRGEAELFGVMCHEVSHVALRHGTSEHGSFLSNVVLPLGILVGASELSNKSRKAGDTVAMAGLFTLAVYKLKYSREDEAMADRLGSHLMARANYDPTSLANAFRWLDENVGSGGPTWLSTHPSSGDRAQRLRTESAAMFQAGWYDPHKTRFMDPEFLPLQAKIQALPKPKPQRQH